MRIQIEDRNEFFVFDTGNETITLCSNYDVEKSVYPSEEVIFYLLNNDFNLNDKGLIENISNTDWFRFVQKKEYLSL